MAAPIPIIACLRRDVIEHPSIILPNRRGDDDRPPIAVICGTSANKRECDCAASRLGSAGELFPAAICSNLTLCQLSILTTIHRRYDWQMTARAKGVHPALRNTA